MPFGVTPTYSWFKSITGIPQNVVFAFKKLEQLEFVRKSAGHGGPPRLVSIGKVALGRCQSLKTITDKEHVAASLETIGESALKGCTSLKTLDLSNAAHLPADNGHCCWSKSILSIKACCWPIRECATPRTDEALRFPFCLEMRRSCLRIRYDRHRNENVHSSNMASPVTREKAFREEVHPPQQQNRTGPWAARWETIFDVEFAEKGGKNH
mmetsp:Transcript_10637/g.23845  ORF Transcript_10637/g.23845 Transcript_10637/m.23845 type:complete len:211 (+) Transcript_10637:40-672(+)